MAFLQLYLRSARYRLNFLINPFGLLNLLNLISGVIEVNRRESETLTEVKSFFQKITWNKNLSTDTKHLWNQIVKKNANIIDNIEK